MIRAFVFAVLRRMVCVCALLTAMLCLIRRHQHEHVEWADVGWFALGSFIMVLLTSLLDLGDRRHESKARPRKDAMRLWADIADPERVAGWRKQG